MEENPKGLLVGVMITLILTVVGLGAGLLFATQRYHEVAHERQVRAKFTGAAIIPYRGAPDPAAGRALFATNCASCHLEDGSGQIGLAPSIRNRDFLALASDHFIKRTVNRGREGTAMFGRPDLSDEDLTHIVAFLRSPPFHDVVPIALDNNLRLDGDVSSGRELYDTFCSSCHGPNGEGYAAGGPGPGIGTPGFLNAASDDYIFRTVAQGRRGTPMMGFAGSRGLANLSHDEIADIIAFLRWDMTAPEYLRAPRRIVHAPKGNSPDATRGKAVFAANCSSCHMVDAQGKPGLAPSIRNRDFLALASDDFISATVIQGRPGTAMLARPDLAGDIPHIIAYLRALPVAHPVQVEHDPTRIRAGDAARGRATFVQFCAPCHGAAGEGYSAGGSGPGIGLPGFLRVASDDFIFQTVKHGRLGTPMKSFMGSGGLASLDESDVNDVITFLRGLDGTN